MTWYGRLQHYWVYGGFLAGIMLLALTPLFDAGWPIALVAVWLALPIYMLHQFEEHEDDRFARFINEHVGHGRQVLPQSAIFWINVGGVWILDVVVIWLAATAGIGWGLMAIWLMLVNALLHIAQGLHMRKYNPGLITSIILFLPLAAWASWTIIGTGEVASVQYAVAVIVAVGMHAGILGLALRNLRAQTAKAAG